MTILFDLSNCIMVSFSWKLLTKSIDRICLSGFLIFFLCRNLVGAQFNFTDATLISEIDFLKQESEDIKNREYDAEDEFEEFFPEEIKNADIRHL